MRTRHILAAVATAALVAGGVVGLAAPASADSTATSYADLQIAFETAGPTNQNISLDNAIDAASSVLTLPSDGNLTLTLDGYELDLQNIVLGVGSTLTITDTFFHQSGILHVDASSTSTDAGIQTTGATLDITGNADVTAFGGSSGAGVGGVGASPIPGGEGPVMYTVGGAGGTVNVGGAASLSAVGGPDGTSGIGGGGLPIGAGSEGGAGGSLTITGQATVDAQGESSGVGGGAIAVGGPITIGDDAGLEAGASDSLGSALGTGEGFYFTGVIDESPVQVDGLLTLDSRSYNNSTITGHGVIQGPGTIDNNGAIIHTIVVDTAVTGHSYPIQFFLNEGGNGSSATDDSYASIRVYGPTLDSVELSLIVPTRTDYLFGGWNLLPDGSGEPLKTSTPDKGFQIAYAQWLATISKVSVSGSSFSKGAAPKVKATVGKTSIGTYAVGEVDIYVNSVFTATGTLTLADKGVISITLPAQTKTIKVQAVYLGNSTTETKSSSIISVKVK